MKDFEQQRLEVYCRTTITAVLQTYSWLMELKGMEALTLDDLREYNQNITNANEKLRKKIAKRNGIAEFKNRKDTEG